MINNYVTNLKPASVTINNVTTNAAADNFSAQLPSVVCDEVVFTSTNGGAVVEAALSNSPGSNFIVVANGANSPPVTLSTGPTRNANVWFVANHAAAAITFGFMCLTYDTNKAFPTNRGTAG